MESYHLLINTFRNPRKIILPNIVPPNILSAVYAQSIVFHPNSRYPLLRSQFKSDYFQRQKSVKIVGELDKWTNDPTIDILLSFEKSKCLFFRRTHFTN